MKEHSKVPLHTREKFNFLIDAPFDVVWPLFGADGERAWCAGWHPLFVWPHSPADRQGMVFTVGEGDRAAVWVNTCFDKAARRIQYVYFVSNALVTVITLGLKAIARTTDVEVVYERTALRAALNDRVSRLASTDRVSGPDWSGQISRHLHVIHAATNCHTISKITPR